MFVDEAENHTHQYIEFALGAPLPRIYNWSCEGARISFAHSGPIVIFKIHEPDKYEKNAFRAAHPLKVGLFKTYGLGFLLFDFGEGLLFDAPFHTGIEHHEALAVFSEFRLVATRNTRIAMLLVGVDSSTGLVFSFRDITLSAHISSMFVKLVLEQAEQPIGLSQMIAKVEDAYERYPDIKTMFVNALGMDKAG